jgi:hypothetical protein
VPELPEGYEDYVTAELVFNGTSAVKLTSIKFSREVSILDLTGFSGPDRIKRVWPGDIEEAVIQCQSLGTVPFNLYDVGELGLALINGAGQAVFAYTFDVAFLKSIDLDASVGEHIKASYTFVAYESDY